ncbi:hypothetical protein [[Phormidium] sp. ETS-05]|uniref:hypothetical protein n=1 Tax=[Phormidium] sp. ETS-05 TaxID=222819 RepID=UPI0018EEFB39|nr:hypothetical protein [[Phormidium] sp. ETS-05]
MTWRARHYKYFGQPPNINDAVPLQAIIFVWVAQGSEDKILLGFGSRRTRCPNLSGYCYNYKSV